MTGRRTGLCALLVLVAATGAACGSSSSTSGSTPPPANRVITVVSATGAGGTVSTHATPVPDAAALADYVGQFRGTAVAVGLAKAMGVTDLAAGQALYAAVVSVGCDVAPGADVQVSDGAVLVTAQEVASPTPECLAPVTSVALVSAAAGS